MNTIKSVLLLSAIFLSSSAFAAEDCIIDPQLMNSGTWAEPLFSAAIPENSREPASAVETVMVKSEKSAEQYLEVQKTIPHSEPSISQAWIEHKIANEN
jgi:hypothetical protein